MFVVTRLAVFQLGITGDAFVPRAQIIDRDLLSADLLRSLFYLHIQPPLFNGFLGTVLKLAGENFQAFLATLYWAMGLAVVLLMFFLLRELGVSARVAFCSTTLYLLGPAALLYETFYFYTYPCALVLLGVVTTGRRFLRVPGPLSAASVSLLIAALALTRSLFHLVWVIGAVVMLWLLGGSRKAILPWLAGPALLLVGALYVKNWILFDTFSSSSMLGLNLYRIATDVLDPESRDDLVESGELSPFALMAPARPVDLYPLGRGELPRIEVGAWESRAWLGSGWWRTAEGRGQARFRWSVGPRSILVFPLETTEPREVRVRLAPLQHPEALPQSIRVRVAGVPVDEFVLAESLGTYSFRLPAELLQRGLNTVRFDYGWTASPRSLGLGSDSRRLAVRWQTIEILPPAGATPGVVLGRTAEEYPRVPILARTMKRDGGPNLNHALYPAVMSRYVRDARHVVLRRPGLYLSSAGKAMLIFLASPTEHPAFTDRKRAIRHWEKLYARVIYGTRGETTVREHSHRSRALPVTELLRRTSWHYVGLILVALPIILVSSLSGPRTSGSATLLFMLYHFAYVALAANLLEFGENNRFRMMVEPLLWILFTIGLCQAGEWIQARRAADRSVY